MSDTVIKYVHYGHTAFKPELFMEIKNQEMFVKPKGGLWASPIQSKFGWKDWCKSENFRVCNDENSFTFSIKENANIINLYSKD